MGGIRGLGGLALVFIRALGLGIGRKIQIGYCTIVLLGVLNGRGLVVLFGLIGLLTGYAILYGEGGLFGVFDLFGPTVTSYPHGGLYGLEVDLVGPSS